MSEQCGQDIFEALTTRELEILRLLAEGLSNQQIAYQLSLTVNTVKVHLRHIFAKLNVENRAAAVAQAGKLSLLNPAPHHTAQSDSTHNLPEYLTSFIGRTQELQDITATLDDPACRLLTLSGLGGIGKTRLAIQVARVQFTRFSDGVFFVALQGVSSPQRIAIAIAEAIGFPFYGREVPKVQVLNYLRNKHLLLVLDNFEHLLPGVDLVTELLQAAPKVKVLVTSREATGLQEEWLRSVSGLKVPGQEDAEHVEHAAAGELFVARARQLLADFSPDQDREAIVRICQLVAGMPLALELAASWVMSLSCQEIADEIQHNLEFLTGTRRNVPERHQSIHGVFEQSWRLLTDKEREVLPGLSMFRNGFTREAAQAVAGASLPVLTSLTNKSLLRRNPGTGRYEIHELLRQYAEAQLVASGAYVTAREAYGAFFVAFMAQRFEDLKTDRQKMALDKIEVEFENIKAMWDLLIQTRQWREIRICANALWLFARMRSQFHEIYAMLKQAVDVVRPVAGEHEADLTLGSLLARYAWLGVPMGTFTQAMTTAQEAVATRQQIEAQDQSHTQAMTTAQEAIVLLQRWNDGSEEVVIALLGLYLATLIANEPEQYRRAAQESVQLARRLDNRWLLAPGVSALSTIAMVQQNYEEAIRFGEEALQLALESGDLYQIAHCTGTNLGWVANYSGNYERAYRYYSQSLRYFSQLDLPVYIAVSHTGLGDASAGLQNYMQARYHYQQSLQISTAYNLVDETLRVILRFGQLLAKQDNKQRALELVAFVLDHPGTWGYQRQEAKQLRLQLQVELSPEVYADAVAQGKALELEAVVQEIITES